MKSIQQEVRIQAAVGKIYEALTTQGGFRAWWNGRAELSGAVGSEAKLYFVKDGTPVNMRFRIDETKPNERVRWTCVGHDMPSWIGTTLDFGLKGTGSESVVAFEHAGWKDAAPEPVAEGWRHFMGSLKSYLETGTGQPW